MKHSIKLAFIIVGLAAFQSLKAQTTTNSDDLQLTVIFAGKTDPNASPDGYINCLLKDLTTNQTIAIAYEPESSYSYYAELFDANGLAVPKTELGQSKGFHFADLDQEVGLKKSSIKFDDTGGSRQVHLLYKGNKITASPIIFAHGHANCPMQPMPLELFHITNAGEYKLKLTFQFFELVDHDAIKLIRFPTIEEKITVTPEDLKLMKMTSMPETGPPSTSTPASTHDQTVPPLQVKSSTVLNTPHPALAFAGYGSPDSALETWIWASLQGDKTNMLQSLTSEAQKDFKQSLDGKTDVQIKKDAARIAATFQGYTVQKMDIVSDTEVILNYTFAGSDLIQKMIIKKVGNEWKVAGPSPDSAVISTSVPAQRIQAQKN